MPPIWFTKDTPMAATYDRNYRQPLSTAKAQKGKKQNLVVNSKATKKGKK